MLSQEQRLVGLESVGVVSAGSADNSVDCQYTPSTLQRLLHEALATSLGPGSEASVIVLMTLELLEWCNDYKERRYEKRYGVNPEHSPVY